MHHFAKPSERLILVIAAVAVLAALPLVSDAPNRLLSGQGEKLAAVLTAAGGIWAFAGAALAGLFGVLLMALRRWPEQRALQWLLLLELGAVGLWLLALTGHHAAAVDLHTEGLGRTTLASGFWLSSLLLWLLANEVMRQLKARAATVVAYWALWLLAVLALTASGALDALSTLKEYANREEDFWRGLGQHLFIILLTSVLTLGIGLPLGVALHRRPVWALRVFPVLNLVQTVPSIALFGLLMALLSSLGQRFPLLPALGIQGVGLAPAVLALTAYSLLPLVRSTYEGLAHLPRAVVESGTAMGLSRGQLLWQVELPLALPVLLSGLKVMLIQTIGLTAVAALIGAGGLGSLMFEGLFSSALDLVLLAVAPIVVLAWLAEALFIALGAWARRWARG